MNTLAMNRTMLPLAAWLAVFYAPDFAHKQRPFVRVSFGIEHRLAAAADRLRQACAATFVA